LKKTELKKIQSGSHDNLYFILDIMDTFQKRLYARMKSLFQTKFIYYIFSSTPNTISLEYEINLYNIYEVISHV